MPQWYLVPTIKPVHDRLIIEAARGCLNACRFCQAGYINRPLREKNPRKICDETLRGLTKTGYNEVSLLSLSIADYSRLTDIFKTLTPFLKQYHVNVSFPSLRIEKFTSHLEDIQLPAGKSGFTFAPEAGTERLRRIINKLITDEEIEKTINLAFSKGWQVLKLYFMLGLPGEEQDDIEGIISLIHQADKTGSQYHRRYQVNVSLSPFIPKPHTPFQWSRHSDPEVYKDKISYIRRQCRKLRNVSIKYPDLGMNQLEAFLARADRRASELILDAVKQGAYLDTWDENFQAIPWKDLIKAYEQKYDYDCREPYTLESPLPWDIIDPGINRAFLVEEYHKSVQEITTSSCLDENGCYGCGACSPPHRKNIPASKEEISDFPASHLLESSPRPYRYWVLFSKSFSASYTGHLDFIRNIEFIMRRSHLPLLFTQGYRPKVKISFYDALPLFWESNCEIMEMHLSESINPDETTKIMNEMSVDGILFDRVLPLPENTKSLNKLNIISRYRITFETAPALTETDFHALNDDSIKSVKQTSPCTYEIDIAGTRKKFRSLLDSTEIRYSVCKTQLQLQINKKEIIL